MDTGNMSWLLISAALVLFMTPGLAFFYGGMVRSKNVLNMLMMNFWCLLTIPVLWAVIGYSIAGANGADFDKKFIGSLDFAFLKGLIDDPTKRKQQKTAEQELAEAILAQTEAAKK